MRYLPLLILMGSLSCSPSDGLNPPPMRAAETVHTATKPEQTTHSTATSSQAIETLLEQASAPQMQRIIQGKSNRNSERLTRIGEQTVITHRLLDQLDNARLKSVHAKEGFKVMKPGKRNFLNPWARGKNSQFNRRHVWTDGATAQWSLRTALTIPVPARFEWDLTVPSNASLTFGLALGMRVNVSAPVTLSIGIVKDAKTSIVWTEKLTPKLIHKLKKWRDYSVNLEQFAKQDVTLFIDAKVENASNGYRYLALFSEPTITMRVRDADSRMQAAKYASLDVADNVLLVIIDAQRGDLVGPKRKSPRLFDAAESIADNGTTFTNAYSVGNQTRLSTYALLSGQYPSYAGFHHPRWNYTPIQKAAFYENQPPMLPLVMRQMGYRVASVANNIFLFGNMELSLDTGFDRVIDHRHGTKDTAWITASTKEWIRSHQNERWFMMVNYNTPHTPYQPPAQSYNDFKAKLKDVEGLSKTYLGEVKWADENLGELLNLLQELKLTERTMVIVTSDHGEVMDPRHECYSYNWKSSCLHNHGKTLYDEELHVPLIMQLPGRIAKQHAIETPVSHLDLAPTILGLVGAKAPQGLLGRDHSAAMLENSQAKVEEQPVLAEARLSTALRWKQYKYIVHDKNERMKFKSKTLFDKNRSLDELYNLTDDPSEVTNLAWDKNQPMLLEMRKKLREIQSSLRKNRVHGASTTPDNEFAISVKAPSNDMESSDADDTYNSLLFHPGGNSGEFGGTISTSGEFIHFEIIGDAESNRSSKTNEQLISVNASSATSNTGVRFATLPPNASISFKLTYNGTPVNATQFYVGAYGLILYAADLQDIEAEQLELAQASKNGPTLIPNIPSGLFYWRWKENEESQKAASIESAGEIDSEVRELMKSWGYVAK